MQQLSTPSPAVIPKKGDCLELTITDWGDRGRGIARHGSLVVLTDKGLPGEMVAVRVTKRRQHHLEASVESIITPSPHRVPAPCRHFGECGGCRLLDLDYPEQLRGKVRHLTEQLRRIGQMPSLPDVEVIACDPPFRYRNKMEFSFGRASNGALTLGLHPRENYRDSFDLHECWLTDERASAIVAAIREFLRELPEMPYDPVKHTGFWRFVVVRFGVNTGDVMVNTVTAEGAWPSVDEFARHLQTRCPYVTTALWTINSSRANVANGRLARLLYGPGVLRERLGPFEFEIAPGGFFQTNTRQAERLFTVVADWAGADGGDVLDLYCGAGSISLVLSQRARSVLGVEVYPESVVAAERNASRNAVTNCRFVCSDVLEFLRRRPRDEGIETTVVIDPPRVGLHPKVVRLLAEDAPARLVYVSCNTAALARDLFGFKDLFRLSKLAAVDMFPHTPHIEAVALLERV